MWLIGLIDENIELELDADDPLTLAQAEEQLPLPNEMSFDQDCRGINEVRNVKTEPNYRSDEPL